MPGPRRSGKNNVGSMKKNPMLPTVTVLPATTTVSPPTVVNPSTCSGPDSPMPLTASKTTRSSVPCGGTFTGGSIHFTCCKFGFGLMCPSRNLVPKSGGKRRSNAPSPDQQKIALDESAGDSHAVDRGLLTTGKLGVGEQVPMPALELLVTVVAVTESGAFQFSDALALVPGEAGGRAGRAFGTRRLVGAEACRLDVIGGPHAGAVMAS